MIEPTVIERRLRRAAILVFVGLLVEMISLLWAHPTAFILFLIPGAMTAGIGILLFLYSLVSGGSEHAPVSRRTNSSQVPPETSDIDHG